MKRILVLCTGKIARAGVAPHGVNPLAIQVMAEDGINISHHTVGWPGSNHVDEYTDKPFDYVITVCDNACEQCLYFPSSAKRFALAPPIQFINRNGLPMRSTRCFHSAGCAT